MVIAYRNVSTQESKRLGSLPGSLRRGSVRSVDPSQPCFRSNLAEERPLFPKPTTRLLHHRYGCPNPGKSERVSRKR